MVFLPTRLLLWPVGGGGGGRGGEGGGQLQRPSLWASYATQGIKRTSVRGEGGEGREASLISLMVSVDVKHHVYLGRGAGVGVGRGGERGLDHSCRNE